MSETKMLEAMEASNLTPEEFGYMLGTAGSFATWGDDQEARNRARIHIRALPHGREILDELDKASRVRPWGSYNKDLRR